MMIRRVYTEIRPSPIDALSVAEVVAALRDYHDELVAEALLRELLAGRVVLLPAPPRTREVSVVVYERRR